jgi:hypothetical protein
MDPEALSRIADTTERLEVPPPTVLAQIDLGGAAEV